nr:LapA family protein [uncultured Rhodopila sp.]
MLFLLVTLIITVPLVLFALSNQELVPLALWPTDYSIEVPLAIAILVALGLGFLLGAFVVWFSALTHRRRARRAERKVRLLEAHVDSLKARTGSAASLPPAA